MTINHFLYAVSILCFAGGLAIMVVGSITKDHPK